MRKTLTFLLVHDIFGHGYRLVIPLMITAFDAVVVVVAAAV